MPFIDNILNYKTLSIVGLEKNTGKTECMNYVIKQLKNRNIKFAITSIGIDGESTDLVTNTQKPEIELFENTIFVTSEMHYKQRKILSEVMDVGSERTSLGRLVTARTLSRGKVILSGPSNTSLLKQYLQKRESFGVGLFIVDGALSRLSFRFAGGFGMYYSEYRSRRFGKYSKFSEQNRIYLQLNSFALI